MWELWAAARPASMLGETEAPGEGCGWTCFHWVLCWLRQAGLQQVRQGSSREPARRLLLSLVGETVLRLGLRGEGLQLEVEGLELRVGGRGEGP